MAVRGSFFPPLISNHRHHSSLFSLFGAVGTFPLLSSIMDAIETSLENSFDVSDYSLGVIHDTSTKKTRDNVRQYYIVNDKITECSFCHKKFSNPSTSQLKGHLSNPIIAKEYKTRLCDKADPAVMAKYAAEIEELWNVKKTTPYHLAHSATPRRATEVVQHYNRNEKDYECQMCHEMLYSASVPQLKAHLANADIAKQYKVRLCPNVPQELSEKFTADIDQQREKRLAKKRLSMDAASSVDESVPGGTQTKRPRPEINLLPYVRDFLRETNMPYVTVEMPSFYAMIKAVAGVKNVNIPTAAELAMADVEISNVPMTNYHL